MSNLIKDAFKDIMPKKKEESEEEVYKRKKEAFEKLENELSFAKKSWQEELNKKQEQKPQEVKVEFLTPQKAEQKKEEGITADQKIDLLAKEVSDIVQDLHERITTLERDLLKRL